MRLADFIRHEREQIIREWQAFAATLAPAADTMTVLALRDHASEILEAIAHDLDAPQTRHEQSAKSQGRAPVVVDAPETAAQTHAVLRATDGFDIIQLVAEYRALRASVLRLWLDRVLLLPTSFEDMTRFNEAIDQAVAESVGHFHALVERRRHLMLGMMSHDMRAPLHAIMSAAAGLQPPHTDADVGVAAERVLRGTAALRIMLDDLTAYTSTRLGLGVAVAPAALDLATVLHDEVEQVLAIYPARQVRLTITGRTHGSWDPHLMPRLLRNLLVNAMRYGEADTPVEVHLAESTAGVRLTVSNRGAPVDAGSTESIFDPFTRGAAGEHAADGGLGLGLFIVREIATAHRGVVDVRADGADTTFVVTLPYA